MLPVIWVVIEDSLGCFFGIIPKFASQVQQRPFTYHLDYVHNEKLVVRKLFFLFCFVLFFFLKSPFLLISIEGRGGGKLLTCVCLHSAPRSSPPKFGLVYVMTDGGIFLLNFPILCIHTHALTHTHTHTHGKTQNSHTQRGYPFLYSTDTAHDQNKLWLENRMAGRHLGLSPCTLSFSLHFLFVCVSE